jgi:hypothetical protein
VCAGVAEDRTAAEGYRGTVALNVAVTGRPREIVLVALDVWQHVCVLRGAATLDRENPFWLPGSWKITTDVGTSHASRGGGGAWLRWLVNFEPSLPEDAEMLRFFVGPDDERMHNEASLPDEPSAVIVPSNQPITVRRVPASFDGARELTALVDRGPNLEADPLRPDRVIPVSAQLDEVVGRDINVLSIDVRPSWFFLHMGGRGGLNAAGTCGAESTVQRLHRRWTAEDNRGGRYHGTIKGTHSGWPWTIDATFTPTLDPTATALKLEFPNPFDDGVVSTTVELSP